jgi:ribonuclease J
MNRAYEHRDHHENSGRNPGKPRYNQRFTNNRRAYHSSEKFHSRARYLVEDEQKENTQNFGYVSLWNTQKKTTSFDSLPPLHSEALRVIPLGGIGEIGKNANLFIYKNKAILVDYGILFPDITRYFGVNLISPNIEEIGDYMKLLSGIFLTHGHEDHIGALPFILRNHDTIPIYATKYTAALLRIKFKEFGLRNVNIKEVSAKEEVKSGLFTVTFFHVTHSIPDASALLIRAGDNTVFNTGDFKVDSSPIDKVPTDVPGILETLNKENVKIDLAMVDSTNAEVAEDQKNESNIIQSFLNIFSQHKNNRIILTCFASHVHRIQQAIDAASKFNRKICFVGHSMMKTLGICQTLRYLNINERNLVFPSTIDNLKDSELLIICTGSQGEPMSSLYKMAHSLHDIKIRTGDVVVLSSSVIPGNETSVYNVFNRLIKLGVHLYHAKNSMVHVSGHANVNELMFFLSMIKPKNLMPIHGEWRHLKALANIGERLGMSRDKIALMENGVALDLHNGKLKIAGSISADPIYMSPWGSRDALPEELFLERKRLATFGFILIVAKNIATQPVIDIYHYGTIESLHDKQSITRIRSEITNTIKKSGGQNIRNKIKSQIETMYGFSNRNRPEILVVTND